MADKPACGAPTNNATRCSFPVDTCPHHGDWQSEALLRSSLASRDPHGIVWWLIERAAREKLEVRFASVVNQTLRTLIQLGQAGADEEQALASIVVRGRLMHGLPPANPEQWALAESMFAAEALEEFRRWPKLLEDDASDGREPLYFREQGRGQHQLSGSSHVDNDAVADFAERSPHESGQLAADLLPFDSDEGGLFGADSGSQFTD